MKDEMQTVKCYMEYKETFEFLAKKYFVTISWNASLRFSFHLQIPEISTTHSVLIIRNKYARFSVFFSD